MIKTGRYGAVRWDPAGTGSPAALEDLISINKWKLSLKTDKVNVTCFNDTNKVYVPGMKDISGSFAGFWNSSDITLFRAIDQDDPGTLELIPNLHDEIGSPAIVPAWQGLAYLDADIDTQVDGAPAITGTFVAGGLWSLNLADAA